jgi:hypothetical protein
LAQTTSTGRPAGGRQQVRGRDRHAVPHRLGDRVLAGEVGRVAGCVGGDDLHLAEHRAPPEGNRQGHRDGAAPGPDVGHGERRRAGRARRASQSLGDRAEREVDEDLRLGARDQGPGVHGECRAVELLEAADVGHGLPRGTPVDEGEEASRRLRPHGTLGMGEDGGSLDAERVGQEQLRVQARALRAARAEAVDRGRQVLADRRHRGVPRARAHARA